MAMKQISLKGMLEFTAGCGFVCAIGPGQDAILNGITCAVIAIWSLRVSRSQLRWILFNIFAGCSSICFGVACLEQAFLTGEQGFKAADYWLLCGCGLIVWTPLACLNAFLFLTEYLRSVRADRVYRKLQLSRAT